MAELLVLTKAGANRRMSPGDVVTVQPDGWQWGRAEAGPDAHQMWTVIRVPGVPVSAFAPMLNPVEKDGLEVLFRRTHYDLLRVGHEPTFEHLQAAMVEKTVIPLLS